MHVFSKALLALAVSVAVLAAPSVAKADGHGHHPVATKQVVQTINKKRSGNHRSVLRTGPNVRQAAARWAHSMIRYDYLGTHLMPGRTPFGKWIYRFAPKNASAANYAFYQCGRGQPSAAKVLRGFNRSVMLARAYDRVGVHWSSFGGPFLNYEGRGRCHLVTVIVWGRA